MCVFYKRYCAGKLEGQGKATFAALFGLRAGGVDLSAAYRYNQNMMEYYTYFERANGGAAFSREGERSALIGGSLVGGKMCLCAWNAFEFEHALEDIGLYGFAN
ncbi:unnamed protein product [Colias eurytheme]|nr:unnamed protein product [Colias eurytheme]